MNLEIINIGDELLIGQVVNTNASWMAERLNENGMNVTNISIIADNAGAIEDALKKAIEKSDAVLITGGLGPTKDDITKFTLCRFFNSELIESKETLENIRAIFTKRGYELTETNRKQAEVPACCKVLTNHLGTAPGMWFEIDRKVIVSLPGVPSEMKALVNEQILPMLKKHFKTAQIRHKVFLCHGIGESFLSDKLEDFEAQLPRNISLAYLPNLGTIRLRLSGIGDNQTLLTCDMELQAKKLQAVIEEYMIADEDTSLEELVGKLLLQNKTTLSVAESCTGGSIAQHITSIPGSSAYFNGSVVSYSNNSKKDILGVQNETLAHHGAVSEQTAKEMALGAKLIFNTDFAIATTGIAGPDGGTAEKPVGTVWIALASSEKTEAHCFYFGNNRQQIIQRTTNQALASLVRILTK